MMLCFSCLQSATLSSIRSDIIEYERMAMESAAQVRQKWMQAEGVCVVAQSYSRYHELLMVACI